jgi:hypothetical protein
MTKNEIARLKERLRTEYEHKIKAIELVEQMLAEAEPQAESPKLNGFVSKPPVPTVPTLATPPLPKVATLTPGVALSLDDAIETQFKGRSGWTVPEVLAALNLSDYQRGTVWNAVQRLVDAGKVRVIQEGAGRRAAQYAWAEGHQQTSTGNVS